MPPDTNDEERHQELPEDNQTPFQPADPPRDEATDPDSARQLEENQLDDTHPVTDNANSLQPEELYDESISGAAEASEPNVGNAVTGYTPPQNDRDEDEDGEDLATQPS